MLYTILKPDSSTITLDCVQSFTESRTATATQHPVETGSAITDHVFLNNAGFTMKGVVSDFSPNNTMVTIDVLDNFSNPSSRDSHTDVIKKSLLDIFRNRVPVTILSGNNPNDLLITLEQFDNCVITGLSFADSEEAGEAVYPDIKFAQLRMVTGTTRKETAVPDLLFTNSQEADIADTKDSADKTEKANQKPAGYRPEQAKKLTQLKANTRITQWHTTFKDMSVSEVISNVSKEMGVSIDAAGNVTSGLNPDFNTDTDPLTSAKAVAKVVSDPAVIAKAKQALADIQTTNVKDITEAIKGN